MADFTKPIGLIAFSVVALRDRDASFKFFLRAMRKPKTKKN
jgi:hypothetical protein